MLQGLLFLASLALGLWLTGWGALYLLQRRRFAARRGDSRTSSPWQIICCGLLALALAVSVALAEF
ncbi:hypothetical protein J5J10_08300 [Ciceribacter sp. L1K23]|uniref:hypothetical protein n=1 Tax=Ciceribacter sp. L1K23 TaxID=2820276 RepID=UPI001B8294A5|nr:hypothetical protein [Ciceribacter sp. L1K23]MBR0555682.1 hypothetical protein [Ciceribacter sp. L1K23]